MSRCKTNLVDSKLLLVCSNRLNTLTFQYKTLLKSINNPINSIKKLVLAYNLIVVLQKEYTRDETYKLH